MRTFKDLVAALPLPEVPIETDGDWAAVTKQLGTDLPEEYRQFITLYGTGDIGDMMVANPFAENPHLNLLHLAETDAKHFREQNAGDFPIGYPVFPEPGGILSFGYTNNGDTIHWHTVGPPSNWHVGVYVMGEGVTTQSNWSFIDFLIRVIDGTLEPYLFPRELFADAVFIPAAPYEEEPQAEVTLLREKDELRQYEVKLEVGCCFRVWAPSSWSHGSGQAGISFHDESEEIFLGVGAKPSRDHWTTQDESDSVEAMLMQWVKDGAADEGLRIVDKGDLVGTSHRGRWLKYFEARDDARIVFFYDCGNLIVIVSCVYLFIDREFSEEVEKVLDLFWKLGTSIEFC